LGGFVLTYSYPSFDRSEKVIAYFNKESDEFFKSTYDLYTAVQLIDSSNNPTITRAKEELRNCRTHYKRISFFLDYFFPHQAWIYNAPPKYEVEEPFIEYEEPHGLQYIELLLFDTNPGKQKVQLNEQTMVIMESAKDLKTLLYHFKITDSQVMESMRIELIRVMTLYIAGYDAPYLKSGIAESLESLRSIQEILSLYLLNGEKEDRLLSSTLQNAILGLKSSQDFNSFDRLIFLSKYAIPLERVLSSFIDKKGLTICSVPNLDYKAKDLFSGEVISTEKKDNKEIIALGKKLFYEKTLSGNFTRACASCHQPEKYYTDQLRRNISLDHHSSLQRNTPTLLYAAFQTAQFWDGRTKSLHDQIFDVLQSPKEMNSSLSVIEKRLNHADVYTTFFRKAFHLKYSDTITIDEVSIALESFLRTLAPGNSAFDQYMHGNKKAMTGEQKKGFNLFMGKAQCGTCHFIPLFNGLTPPSFNRSEYEVLGVPSSDNLSLAKEDKDLGRYSFFPVSFYRSAFKTPTLRNVIKTKPYMHNGAFRSLSKVMDFYNKGGGAGLGVHITNQTLPEKPLHLTEDEMKSVILFLGTLTDKLKNKNPN